MLSPEKRQRNSDTLGSLIKSARGRVGFTQKELADAIGLEYYTMISQIELGYVTVPPALWAPLANALRLDKEEWVLLCLSEVQPEVYSALFEDRAVGEVKDWLIEMKRRKA